VRLVEDNPAQAPLRRLEYWRIGWSQEKIFEHRNICYEDRGWAPANISSALQLDIRGSLAGSARSLGRVAVEEREPDLPTKSLGPSSKPLALALDQRVERIEQNCAYPSAMNRLAKDVVEDGDQKALGLPRTGARGN
jgi:hypothetical protein